MILRPVVFNRKAQPYQFQIIPEKSPKLLFHTVLCTLPFIFLSVLIVLKLRSRDHGPSTAFLFSRVISASDWPGSLQTRLPGKRRVENQQKKPWPSEDCESLIPVEKQRYLKMSSTRRARLSMEVIMYPRLNGRSQAISGVAVTHCGLCGEKLFHA